MKFYKERFKDYDTGDEVRIPIVIDESRLRKADFYIREEEVENDTVPIPAGFPKNYPKGSGTPVKNTHIEKRYIVEMEFDDGCPLVVTFRDKYLWLDAMEVVCRCDTNDIFGGRDIGYKVRS